MAIRLFVITLMILNLTATKADENDIAVFVDAGDNEGLISAIEAANNQTGPDLIFIRPGPNGNNTFTFTQPYNGTDSALPPITTNVEIFPADSLNPRITFERDLDAPPFRLATVSSNISVGLSLGVFNVENFSIQGNGGAIFVTQNAYLICRGVSFRNNFASGEGGAIYLEENAKLAIRGTGRLSMNGPTEFRENRSGTLGGAISLQGTSSANIQHSVFVDNNATVFGCDINVNSSINPNSGNALSLSNSTFTADCPNVLLENPNGRIDLRNNTFTGNGDGIDSTDFVSLFGNLFNLQSISNKSLNNKNICDDFGTSAFESLGYNISNEGSCQLVQNTDLPNTNPMTNEPDSNFIVSLKSGSPAIDTGPFEMLNNPSGFDFLPCSYVDSRGLGRPQDANGDGVFECDMGNYEVQGGEDLSIAQSGAFFDTNRDGEGVFIEMLSESLALIAMYTYDPNKTDLMWFVGVGQVVGNSIVIDEVNKTEGGAFGAAFNADNIVSQNVGSLALVFPDCTAQNKPGRLVFDADSDSGLENLLVKSSRLTRVLNCGNNAQNSPMSGRSGSFFQPSRSGEGVFVEVLDNGTPIITMYTYTPDGKQFWMISNGAQINGDTITAPMLYAAQTTGFGSGFNSSEIEFLPWGTITMKYLPGCNNVTFSYDSIVNGFGSGQYNYKRLTVLAGTTCDL